MIDEYAAWIKDFLAEGDPTGKCEEATLEMSYKFSELERVRGHVFYLTGPSLGSPHWWLKDSENTIIDPTSSQFPQPILMYEEWDESRAEPTGKCPNCGEYCYNGDSLCSNSCERDYLVYLENPDMGRDLADDFRNDYNEHNDEY